MHAQLGDIIVLLINNHAFKGHCNKYLGTTTSMLLQINIGPFQYAKSNKASNCPCYINKNITEVLPKFQMEWIIIGHNRFLVRKKLNPITIPSIVSCGKSWIVRCDMPKRIACTITACHGFI